MPKKTEKNYLFINFDSTYNINIIYIYGIINLKNVIIMKLTEDQLGQVKQRIRMKECPNCKCVNPHSMSDAQFQLLSFSSVSDRILLEGQVEAIPTAVVTCKNCGYITQFNLMTLGIIK